MRKYLLWNYINFCKIESNAFLTVGSFSSLLWGSFAGGLTGAGGGSFVVGFLSFRILKILCCRSTWVLFSAGFCNGSPNSSLTCCSLRSCNWMSLGIRKKNIYFSSTLYPAYSRVSGGNLVCLAAELTLPFLLLDKSSSLFPENDPWVRTLLCHCTSTTIYLSIYKCSVITQSH